MENYYTDAILYEDVLEAFGYSIKENYDSCNEVDSEPEPTEEEDFEYKIKPFVISINDWM